MMRCIITVCVWLVAFGCASSRDPNAPPQRKPRDIKLEVGMTRDDVREKYGDPLAITQTSNGEQWYYDNRGQALIPFNFGYRYQFRSFLFGQDGRLIAFHVDDF